MTIEVILDRIAKGIEAIAVSLNVKPVPAGAPDTQPVKRGPGRPPKTEVAAPPAPEPDPFADDEPEAPPVAVTKEQVREALVRLGAMTSQTSARDLMKKIGGADTLAALPADKWAAVHAAARQATPGGQG
jgi:hypothetical protein